MKKNVLIIIGSLILISVLIIVYTTKRTAVVGGENFDYAPNHNELTNFVLQNKYLSKVDAIVHTPTYQHPVYHVVYGKNENADTKILVLFVEKPNAPIKVLDSFLEKDVFSKSDVKQYLENKGFKIPDFDNKILLTPYMDYLLTWEVAWETTNDIGSNVYYRYKFDVKTGKVAEEYIYPSSSK